MGSQRPTEMWALARAVVDARSCPYCDADKGNECWNMKARAYVDPRATTTPPHAVRYPAGNRRINDPANRALLDA